MDRTSATNNVDIGGGRRGYRDRNTVGGLAGTLLMAADRNAIQEELMAVIEGAGLTGSNANLAQLLAAIKVFDQKQAGNYAADAGTANALVLTLAPVPASYAALTGSVIRFKKGASSNSGATTVNLNGLGVVAVTRPDGNALLPGDLAANGLYEAICTGSAFMLLGAVQRVSNMVSITASGSWTVPAGVFRLRAVSTGGGAGGAGCGTGNSGGGGGAGGTAIGWYDVTPGQVISATIGAGGSAGASGGGIGGNGGTTSFGSLQSATGGTGGTVGAGAGGGGGGTGGQTNIDGGQGAEGAGLSSSAYAGTGGASFWGGGGRGGSGSGGGGLAGAAYGSGGGGCWSSAGAGGAGKQGVIQVEY